MLLSTEALAPPPPPSAAPSPDGEEDPCPLIFSIHTCDFGSPELREDRLPTTCYRRHPAKSDPTEHSPRRSESRFEWPMRGSTRYAVDRKGDSAW